MQKRGGQIPSAESNLQEEKLKRKALQISINEGAALSFSSSVGETYITPFALALKASPLHIGLLSAVSGLIAPLSQFFGSKLLERRSRKSVVLTFTLMQLIMWIPLAALGYIFYKGIPQEVLMFLLILFYGMFAAFGGFIYPGWFSWMGDLVPEHKRGVYFAKRNRAIGAISVAAVLIGAFILDAFKTRGWVLIGFAVLFALAFTFHIISYILLSRQYEPPFKLSNEDYFSFWDFLKRFDNYAKFSVFHALFNFAIMISSPFYAVYLLQELKFSYITFMAVTISASVFYLFFTPLAGKFSDKYGNRKLFWLGCVLLSFNPLLWIFIKSPWLLIAIPQVIVGLANAAFLLAVMNYTYDAVTPKRRALAVAYFNILAGAGIFLGSLLGGLLLSNWHPSSVNPFIVIFTIAAVLRFVISIFFIPRIQEVKKVSNLPPMRLHFPHPFKMLHADLNGMLKHSSPQVSKSKVSLH